jgi:hypothetical protein
MTDTQLETFTRSLINEPVSKFWTPEDIDVYKVVAIELVFGEFWNLMLEKYQDYTEVSLQAGVSDLVFPVTGTLDDYMIVKVEVAETGEELDYIESDQVHEFINYPYNYPCAWMFKGGKIHLLPTPPSSQTNWLRIWFLKKMTSLAEIPAVLHPIIGIEMVQLAKTKDEDVTQDILLKRSQYAQIAIHALSISQAQDQGSIEDREGEDGIF